MSIELQKIEKELENTIDKLTVRRSFLIEHKFDIERQFIQAKIDTLENICREIRGLNKGYRNIEDVNFDRVK